MFTPADHVVPEKVAEKDRGPNAPRRILRYYFSLRLLSRKATHDRQLLESIEDHLERRAGNAFFRARRMVHNITSQVCREKVGRLAVAVDSSSLESPSN